MFWAVYSFAQTPTWANDIACLVYTHCTPCHHDNGIAPFSLMTYNDAFTHQAVMNTDVNSHIMPPYTPNVNYQQYIGERYLTTQEIELLNAWFHAGAPEGDSAQAPPPPVYASGPVITNPGFTARIPTYTVPQLSSDLYRCFVVSNRFPQTQYITGLEIIPGNNSAVHHVIVYQDTAYTPVSLDSANNGNGYTSFGSDGDNTGQLVGVWVPGSSPYFTPSGMGIALPAGSRIILQIHYPAGASGLTDSTRINLQLTSDSNLRKVAITPALNYYTNMINGPLVIPANTVDTFYEKYTVPAKVTLLAVGPHAHLVCTEMTSFGVEPNGDTVNFVSGPWNFHWQGLYPFKKPIVIPSGTKLYGRAIYDNTDNNPSNPNYPSQTVSAGESTTNEMMIFFFSYTLYEPGDENAVYDTTTSVQHYDNCVYEEAASGINEIPQIRATAFPNPTSGLFDISITGADECTMSVEDITGKTVLTRQAKAGYNPLDISDLAQGLYFITINDNAGSFKPQTLRIVKE